MQPPRYGFKNLFFKILYAIIEVIISLHVYQYINLYHSILINLFLYLQLLSIIPFFMYFNTTDFLETNPDGPCSSDEFIFNFVLFLKFILISLIFSNYKCFSYELLFYYLCWKMSFSIRTKKLHNWIVKEYYREKYHKYFEEYFIFVIFIYFLNLMYLFRLSSILFIIPIIIECFITMPIRLFKNETDFVPLFFPIKQYDILKSKYKNAKLSTISFYEFTILLLWNFGIELKFIIVCSVFLSIISFVNDSKYRKFYQTSFFKYYAGFIYKALLYFSIILLLNNTSFLAKEINKTDLITILIPLLVFNMGAFFILSQFNYQKYSSAFLIRKLINPIVVFISIILPSIILCIICFSDSIFLNQHIYLSYFFITYAIIASFILILYFSSISESCFFLNSLLLSTKWTDFESHKTSIFSLNESRIEAIQHIIIGDINSNYVDTIRTDLLALSDWTNKNIRDIAYQSSSYRDVINNRFTDFYKDIISTIFLKKNQNVINLFFEFFNMRCLNSVSYKNFHEYSIIYDIMFYFIREEIDIDEKNAKLNFLSLLNRCPFIIYNLDDISFRLDLEEHIVKHIKNIYDYAIKEHKTIFISKYICFSDMFTNIASKRENVTLEINENFVELYNDIRQILRKLIEDSNNEYNYIETCIREVEELSEFLFTLDTDNIHVRHLWDYHLFTCEEIIKKAQEIEYINNSHIFLPLYKILRNVDNTIFNNTLLLLAKLLDDFFTYLELHNINDNIFMYWYALDNLYNNYEKDIEKQKYIKSFMDSLIEKHKHLKSYQDAIKTMQSNFTLIENYDYSKLDIRKKKEGEP